MGCASLWLSRGGVSCCIGDGELEAGCVDSWLCRAAAARAGDRGSSTSKPSIGASDRGEPTAR